MIFMLVVLKIPIVYMGVVIWWAIKADGTPDEPAVLVPVGGHGLPGPDWRRATHARRRPPQGPVRRPPARSASARVWARR